MTMQVLLDGTTITDEAAFHTALREASGVEWYGGNLDALFDLLVGVVSPPIEIVWINAAASRRGIGARFDRIIGVIFDAVEYRGGGDAITFSLKSSV